MTRSNEKSCSMKLRIFAAILASFVYVGGAESADRVRIGVSNYNLSNLTVGVAQTRDFFKQEGIDAEIIRMNPNVATMALVSGDVGYTTLIGSVIGANLKGAKLKMIACSQDRTPLALVGKPEFKSVELYIRTSAAPQVKPPPKATRRTLSPRRMRPTASASQSAIGIEAAEVLPYRWIFTKTFSGGKRKRFATPSMIRTLA